MISIVHGLKEYHLQPIAGASYRYRFETIVDDFTTQKRVVQNNFIREVEIMPIGKHENLDVYQVFTAKIAIKSNVSIADEYLIKQIGYAFDEIEIGVDSSGKIIRIYNKELLLFRWMKRRSELEKEYIGVYIQSYFMQIDFILETEQKLIDFLSSYKMFGLYFNGLFGNYLLWEMPIKRQIVLEDFENCSVEESIYPEKREAVKFKIEGHSMALENYKGQLIYNNFQLQEAFIGCKNETQSISYGAFFLG